MTPCPPRPDLEPFGSQARVALGEEPFLGCGKEEACGVRYVSGRDGPATVRTDTLQCRFCGAVYREPKLASQLADEATAPPDRGPQQLSLFDLV